MPSTMTTAPAETNRAEALLRAAGGHLRRAGLDLAYLLGACLTSIIAFTVWVTGLSVTLSLLILIVGVFLIIATAWLFRWTAELDRRLAVLARGEPIHGLYRSPRSNSLLDLLRNSVTDPQTWKDLAWLVLHSGIGFAFGLGAIVLASVWLGMVTMPLWWTIPDGDPIDFAMFDVTSTGTAILVAAIGLALTPLAMLLLRGMTMAHSSLAALLLGPSEKQRLHARVSELSTSRAGAVEAAQDQLERIERDLHDGAQARMVAVAMELGMAEQELRDVPEATREQIRRARAGALEALAELRGLSRGIRPALLTERGLAVALEALAQRAPIATTLRVSGEVDSAPQNVETAAYFVASEALTNAVKHSGSARAEISLMREGDRLRVAVTDRGRGGADPAGSGLEGLAKRVRALDGRLDVTSPEGGPTEVAATFPIGPSGEADA